MPFSESLRSQTGKCFETQKHCYFLQQSFFQPLTKCHFELESKQHFRGGLSPSNRLNNIDCRQDRRRTRGAQALVFATVSQAYPLDIAGEFAATGLLIWGFWEIQLFGTHFFKTNRLFLQTA